MSGTPPAPAGQPQPLPLQQAPPVTPGFDFHTLKDWFLKFTNIRELANGDHQERVDGVRVSLAASLMTAVTLGWYHSSTVGGSLTQIKGKDMKLGLLTYLGFIRGKKTEITKGTKDEYIAGLKLSHVTGKKNKFQGSNRLSNSEIEKAEFTNKCAEYWELRKELEEHVKQTVKNLELIHTNLEQSIKNSTAEFETAKQEADEANVKATTLHARTSMLLWQASETKKRASQEFKVVADAAAEFTASGTWEGDFGSQIQLHCSFQEFAASISKLG
jgi:hypothetical protein